MQTPDVKEIFATQSIETIGGTPEQFAAYIKSELVKWATVVRKPGARAE